MCETELKGDENTERGNFPYLLIKQHTIKTFEE
jgi:hypothetical protein